MSNKTQLQTNNTELSSLIEAIRGKAAGGGSGDESAGTVETGTLYGSSTRGPALPTTTLYYNLEAIPGLSSKKMIALLRSSPFYNIILSRSNASEEFSVQYKSSSFSLEVYDVTIATNVMTITADSVPTELEYFAI